MPLTPGAKLGSYEILAALGTGGMGEVYRARDTRLDRTVAIKVLPEHLAESPERKQRFEREAKAISQLNHPNIVTIHSVEEADGLHFLTMELVEGKTLSELIPKKGLPLNQFLDIAIALADAVAAAHQKGITHRDLKPDNMMVSNEGRLKILDFGLAKFKQEIAQEGISELPTQSGTGEGRILGTVAYMSPEQAAGKTVDHRTDIFSIGIILYQMLAGQRPFTGDTTTTLLSSIIKDTPASVTEINPVVPRDLGRIVKRCLAKDLSRRYQNALDLRNELEETKQELVSGEAIVGAAPSPMKPTSRQRLIWLSTGALGVIVALIAGGLALWTTSRSSERRSVARFALHLPGDEALFLDDFGGSVALSPDGNLIVYVGRQKGRPLMLYVRSVDQLDGTPITGTEGALNPFFSPDSQWVGFFAGGKLKKVSLKGGAPVILCDVGEGLGGSWGDDGSIVFTPNWSDGLWRVSASGGTPEVVLPPDPGSAIAWPQILPGGKSVLFSVRTLVDETIFEIAILSLETGEHRALVEGWSARYANGYLVFGRAGSLFAAPFDLERLELTDTPVPVVEGVRMRRGTAAEFSLSKDGSLVYVPGDARGEERTLLLVDRNGDAQPLSDRRREYRRPRFSPDGKRLAVSFTESDNQDIWIFDLRGKKFNRLTFGPRAGWSTVWSPDGKRLVFQGRHEGLSLFWKLADGSGPAERISPPTPEDQIPGSWSPQGNLLAFEQDFPGGGVDIYLLQMDGQHEPQPFTDTPTVNEFAPRVSPDGRWIAYMSPESGRGEVYVQPFPAGDGKWQISTEGGTQPVWGPGGRELFYQTGSKLMVVAVETDPEFAAGIPRVLFEDDTIAWGSGLIGFPNYDVSPDGQTFVMVRGEPPITQFNVVLNWFEELKRLVPTNQ